MPGLRRNAFLEENMAVTASSQLLEATTRTVPEPIHRDSPRRICCCIDSTQTVGAHSDTNHPLG